ncbi:MAG: KHG-KDPG bifunctional aldolase [Phycisphaerae bacterium]|nr:MAG: KHG-KDPG bifunctional aldolase [Phycisphaerae bacterium]
MNNQHDETLAAIAEARLLAILRTTDQQRADDAANAVIDGGFKLVEFTMNTPGALELIGKYAQDSRVVVGAGTVLSVEHVEQAIDAGARFIVSPHTDARVIAATRDRGAVSVPGAYSPTEMMQAHDAGADIIKLFPSAADIAQYVRQLVGPLPHLKILPTAGVTPENFQAILGAGAFGVGFVSSLFTPEDIAAENFEAIKRRAESIVAAHLESRG